MRRCAGRSPRRAMEFPPERRDASSGLRSMISCAIRRSARSNGLRVHHRERRTRCSCVLFVSCVSFATSRDRVKGTKKLGGGLFGARLLHSLVLASWSDVSRSNRAGLFKADVCSGLFAFDPLVFQNLFALRQELLVEHEFLTNWDVPLAKTVISGLFFIKLRTGQSKLNQ